MRVMKIFEIEKNYRQHRQRLSSIASSNPKEKVTNSTAKNIQKINNFKKNKVMSELFNHGEKGKKIENDNQLLHRTLIKVYSRPGQTTISRTSSKQSIRSTSSRDSKMKQLRTQNEKINKKISNVESYYASIRKTRQRQKVQKKQEIMEILQTQLKLKPEVMFPNVRRKKKSYCSQSKI